MVTLKNKFQEQQLVQSFHRLRHVYLSMILKPNIYNPKHYNLCYGLDTSFFVWTHGKDKREKFLEGRNSFDNNI